MRKVLIDTCDSGLLTIAQNTDIPVQDMYRALGYLSAWSISDIEMDDVGVYVAADGEMTAVYRNSETGERKYVMGAIWHGDHYGFHS